MDEEELVVEAAAAASAVRAQVWVVPQREAFEHKHPADEPGAAEAWVVDRQADLDHTGSEVAEELASEVVMRHIEGRCAEPAVVQDDVGCTDFGSEAGAKEWVAVASQQAVVVVADTREELIPMKQTKKQE